MSGYRHLARYYDVLTQNVGYARRAAYFDELIRRYARNERPVLLLDLACGTGSLSVELANRGYDVIGTDASQDMLLAASSKAAGVGADILFLCQSMEKLDLYGTVDACVCALDSLNHLPDEAALSRVMNRVALFLCPGGIFVFDVNTAHKHRHVLADNVFLYDLPQVYCVWQNRFHEQGCRVDITLDLFGREADGRFARYTERFSERVFSGACLERCLKENGLRLLEVFAEDTLEKPREDTQRLVYIAMREDSGN